MEPVIFFDVVDHVVGTGATGNMGFFDTDSIYGYDTVVFDAFGDGDFSSAYDWVAQMLPNGDVVVVVN